MADYGDADNRKARTLGGGQKEVDQAPEESMEDWFTRGVGDIQEGEVVRGRVVEVRDSEVLVDIGYKSEGTIAIEEFRHAGSLPKVGDEIEVYLESKEDNEGLIVLSKDKADKIKVWDAISSPTTAARRSKAAWSRSSREGSPWTSACAPSCPAPRSICGRSRTSRRWSARRSGPRSSS